MMNLIKSSNILSLLFFIYALPEFANNVKKPAH